MQNLLHDRSRFAAAHVNAYIYMYVESTEREREKDCDGFVWFRMGGFEGFKRTTRVYVNTIERYSIEDDKWESFSIEGPQLSSLAACAYDNCIYLGGGKNGLW